MTINKIINNINFTYPTSNFLHYFTNLKTSILDDIANGHIKEKTLLKLEGYNGADQVQGLCNLKEKNFIGDRIKVDGFKDSRKILTPTAVDILQSLKIHDLKYCINLNFNLNGIYDIYQNLGRGITNEIKNVHITSKSSFLLKNTFNNYNNDPYSIAFISKDYSIAFAVTTSAKSHKTSAVLKIIEITNDAILIDDGSKYIDVTSFTKGISV